MRRAWFYPTGAPPRIKNKLASGRDKDLIDAANLEELLRYRGRPRRASKKAKKRS